MQTETPKPVKLFVGVLVAPDVSLEKVQNLLESNFGPVDYRSKSFPFDITDYYEKEMGDNLSRLFFSFEKLIDPIEIALIKVRTNELEEEFVEDNLRKVNLDPGYMDTHKIILASAKYGAPKIYVGQGIYADPTLYYRKGRFHPYEWGFPDFRSGIYNTVLLEIRARYKKAGK